MYKLISIVLAALVATGCGPRTENTANAEPANAAPPKGYAFHNVNVVHLTKDDAEITAGQTVVVVGDRITAVADTAAITVPADYVHVDGTNKYIMAGMAEMHGHVPPANGLGQFPDRYLDDVLFLYAANGVTTVRGMLGYPHQLQLKQDIAAGKRIGPTLYLAGPSFNGNSIESPEQATQRVIDQRSEGWDLLKVHPGLTMAEYQAMATTANNANMDFGGHVPSDVGLEAALAAGQRTIDHLDGYLEAIDATDRPASRYELEYLVDLSLRHDVAVVPTQALWATIIGASDADTLRAYPELVYVPQSVRDGWLGYLNEPTLGYFNATNAAVQQDNRQRLVKALFDGGVPMIFGTDAPQLFSVPGFSALHEIRMLRDAGIPVAGILHSATVAAGDYFADRDSFGKIAEGQRADFLLLGANPLINPEVIRSHHGVMVAGKWLSREAIDARLQEIRQAYAEPSAEPVQQP